MNGKKYDAGKNRLELVPPRFIEAVGWVLTDGAAKYGARNWESGLLWSRPYAAILRHLLAWWKGEIYDKESGRNHLWHAATELAFLIEYAETHPELDDRPLFEIYAMVVDRPERANLRGTVIGVETAEATNIADNSQLVRAGLSREENRQRRDISPQNADGSPPHVSVRNASSLCQSDDRKPCDS